MNVDIIEIHNKMTVLKNSSFELIYSDIISNYGTIINLDNPIQYFFDKIWWVEYCLYAEFLSFYFNHE